MFEKVAECPICGGTKFKNQLICQDQLGSGESFVLTDCESCGFRITNPRPNQESILKYYPPQNYAPHQGTVVNLFQLAYKSAQVINLSWKNRLIKSFAESPASILDYGAGTGEFLAKMRKNDWEVFGVEPNRIAREIALKKYSLNVRENISQLPDIQSFKVITLWHVLEHIHDIETALKTLASRMTKESKMMIAVPNYQSWDSQKYGQEWAGYDVPRHLYHFNQKSMKKILKKCGLNLEKTIPMKLDAYYVSILSEQNIKAKMPTLKGLISGFKSNSWAHHNSNNYSSLVYIAKK